MYGLKKILLINKKHRLLRKKADLKIKRENASFFERDLIKIKIDNIDEQITAINEDLQYLQNEKPANAMKVNNNNLNVGAKNESGLHVDFPLIKN